MGKPVIRISEAEAASDFASLLARVRAGTELVIERDANAVAVIRPVAPQFGCCRNLSAWRESADRTPASTETSAAISNTS